MEKRMLASALTPLIALVFTLSVSATEQERDAVTYAGKKQWLLEWPLNDFLRRLREIPQFDSTSTANWKGYTAGWLVKDSKLYLTSFSATTNDRPFSVALLFPDRKLPVIAEWYSGKVHITSGKERVVQGRRVFQRITILHVSNGVVTATNEMKNVREDKLK